MCSEARIAQARVHQRRPVPQRRRIRALVGQEAERPGLARQMHPFRDASGSDVVGPLQLIAVQADEGQRLRQVRHAAPREEAQPECEVRQARVPVRGQAEQRIAHEMNVVAPEHRGRRLADAVDAAHEHVIAERDAVERAVGGGERLRRRGVRQHAPALVDDVPASGDQRHARAEGLERRHHARDAARMQHVVVVQELDVLAARQREALREVAVEAERHCVAHVTHPRAAFFLHEPLDLRSAGIVGDDDLEIAVTLA